jgi:hypothetical protein
MKEKVILRILEQESLKSKLRLQRYGGKKLQGHFYNFWKWLGLYLELFSKIRVSSWNFMDHNLILQKGRGANCKMVGIFPGADLFLNGKITVDSVHHPLTSGTPVHGGLAMAGQRGLLTRGGAMGTGMHRGVGSSVALDRWR